MNCNKLRLYKCPANKTNNKVVIENNWMFCHCRPLQRKIISTTLIITMNVNQQNSIRTRMHLMQQFLVHIFYLFQVKKTEMAGTY